MNIHGKARGAGLPGDGGVVAIGASAAAAVVEPRGQAKNVKGQKQQQQQQQKQPAPQKAAKAAGGAKAPAGAASAAVTPAVKWVRPAVEATTPNAGGGRLAPSRVVTRFDPRGDRCQFADLYPVAAADVLARHAQAALDIYVGVGGNAEIGAATTGEKNATCAAIPGIAGRVWLQPPRLVAGLVAPVAKLEEKEATSTWRLPAHPRGIVGHSRYTRAPGATGIMCADTGVVDAASLCITPRSIRDGSILRYQKQRQRSCVSEGEGIDRSDEGDPCLADPAVYHASLAVPAGATAGATLHVLPHTTVQDVPAHAARVGAAGSDDVIRPLPSARRGGVATGVTSAGEGGLDGDSAAALPTDHPHDAFHTPGRLGAWLDARLTRTSAGEPPLLLPSLFAASDSVRAYLLWSETARPSGRGPAGYLNFHNECLVGVLGNVLYRVGSFCQKNGVCLGDGADANASGAAPPRSPDVIEKNVVAALTATGGGGGDGSGAPPTDRPGLARMALRRAQRLGDFLDHGRLADAVDETLLLCSDLNEFLNVTAPWKALKAAGKAPAGDAAAQAAGVAAMEDLRASLHVVFLFARRVQALLPVTARTILEEWLPAMLAQVDAAPKYLFTKYSETSWPAAAAYSPAAEAAATPEDVRAVLGLGPPGAFDGPPPPARIQFEKPGERMKPWVCCAYLLDGLTIQKGSLAVDRWQDETLKGVTPDAVLAWDRTHAYDDVASVAAGAPVSSANLALLAKNAPPGGRPLPKINTLVDIYNTMSYKTGLSMGCYDVHAMRGEMLTYCEADGCEHFAPLRDFTTVDGGVLRPNEDTRPTIPGDLILRDAFGNVLTTLCKQSISAACGVGTTRACVLVVFGNARTPKTEVHAAAKAICEKVGEVCGGSARLLFCG